MGGGQGLLGVQQQAAAGDDAVAAELGLKDEDELDQPTVDAEAMIEETVEETGTEDRGLKREADPDAEPATKKQKTEEAPFDEEAAFNA